MTTLNDRRATRWHLLVCAVLGAALVHCGGSHTADSADDGGAGSSGTSGSSVAAGGAAGMGVGGAGGAEPPISDEAACNESLDANCKLFESCLPGDLESVWGDVATCKSTGLDRCIANLHAPGIDYSAARLAACARTLATASCNDWVFNDSYDPPECRSDPGTLPDGSPCAVDSQCQGRYCQKPDHKPYNTLCGVCSRKAPLNGACVTLWDCDRAHCASGVCTPFAKTGEACSATTLCDGFDVCLGLSETSAIGQCGAPLRLGASCNPAFDACFYDEGLFCDLSTDQCTRRKLVGIGEPCESILDCRAGATCNPDATGTNRCTPRVRKPRGAACTITSECASGDACFAGVCSPYDPALCR